MPNSSNLVVGQNQHGEWTDEITRKSNSRSRYGPQYRFLILTWHQPNHDNRIPLLLSICFSLSLSLSRATMAAAASSLTIASSFSEPWTKRSNLPLQYSIRYKADSWSRTRRLGLVVSSVSAPKVELRTGPDDLISSLLSKVCISLLSPPS